jgi:type IV pilus assembly protein PilO
MALDTSDPKIQKSILVIFVLCLAGYLYFAYAYEPKTAEVAKVKSELQKVETELAGARDFVENSDTALLRLNLERTTEDLELIKSLLPTSENLSELLEQVSRVADRAGVKSALFEPGTPIQYEMYQERPYKVTLRGGFHETAIFLSDVASLPRIIKPSGLSLLRMARKDREDADILTAKMTLTTYLLTDKPKQAAVKDNQNDKKKKR